jgi:beta-lactamase class A
MQRELDRRALLFSMGSSFLAACVRGVGVSGAVSSPLSPFLRIESSVGGRVGVCAIDTGSGVLLTHRADERFAMCSTFKWVLAAAALATVERGQLGLGEHVAYGPADLLDYAPTTREHVSDGFMTVEALAKTAITNSDNTAANLLMRKVGGPAGVTRFARRLGDETTRLDREEPTLNENAPGDVRDTTTARAMANLMRLVLFGGVLSPAGRDRITAWLLACETGTERLRAGIPASWKTGDKTGTGQRGAVNDVAFVVPPRRAPIVIAAYMSDSGSPLVSLNRAHADVARLVIRLLCPDAVRPGNERLLELSHG